MFSFIKNLFSKKENKQEEQLTAESVFEEEKIEVVVDCKICPLKLHCQRRGTLEHECENAPRLPINFDNSKDSILIIDDNEGMVSFIKDDMEYFNEKGIIDLDKVNLITLSGVHAAFSLKLLYKKIPNIKIKWAIIDITLGGSKMTEEGNIKYTGVDVFEMIHEHTPDLRFLFYTGNNLNPYIKSNEKLINQFHSISGKDIKDNILFKTSMDMAGRRDSIAERLFKN